MMTAVFSRFSQKSFLLLTPLTLEIFKSVVDVFIDIGRKQRKKY